MLSCVSLPVRKRPLGDTLTLVYQNTPDGREVGWDVRMVTYTDAMPTLAACEANHPLQSLVWREECCRTDGSLALAL